VLYDDVLDESGKELAMDFAELSARYKSWSTENLIKGATVDRKDYLPEALEVIERELKARNVSLELRQNIAQTIQQERETQEQQLRGIRGWLLFFVIVVLANSVMGVLSGLSSLSEARAPLALLLLAPQPILGLAGLYVFVVLLLKKPFAPGHARIWLIVSFCYSLALAVILFIIARQFLLTPLPPIAALVWLTYLDESRRVAVTYQTKKRVVEQ
jgi:hypothetical protein